MSTFTVYIVVFTVALSVSYAKPPHIFRNQLDKVTFLNGKHLSAKALEEAMEREIVGKHLSGRYRRSVTENEAMGAKEQSYKISDVLAALLGKHDTDQSKESLPRRHNWFNF